MCIRDRHGRAPVRSRAHRPDLRRARGGRECRCARSARGWRIPVTYTHLVRDIGTVNDRSGDSGDGVSIYRPGRPGNHTGSELGNDRKPVVVEVSAGGRECCRHRLETGPLSTLRSSRPCWPCGSTRPCRASSSCRSCRPRHALKPARADRTCRALRRPQLPVETGHRLLVQARPLRSPARSAEGADVVEKIARRRRPCAARQEAQAAIGDDEVLRRTERVVRIDLLQRCLLYTSRCV